jgi:hypothetical protein
VWGALCREPNFNLDLVLVGQEIVGGREVAAAINSSELLGKRIYWLRDIADSEVVCLYDQCDLVLCPNFHDALGLAVVEGLARGRRVISSSRGALSEMDMGRMTILDPLDKEAWIGEVRAAAESGCSITGSQEITTWDDTAAEVRAGVLSLTRLEMAVAT